MPRASSNMEITQHDLLGRVQVSTDRQYDRRSTAYQSTNRPVRKPRAPLPAVASGEWQKKGRKHRKKQSLRELLKHTLYNYLSCEVEALDTGRTAGDERRPLPSNPPGLPRTGGEFVHRGDREDVLKSPTQRFEASSPVSSSIVVRPSCSSGNFLFGVELEDPGDGASETPCSTSTSAASRAILWNPA